MTESNQIDILAIVCEERDKLGVSVPNELLAAILRLEESSVSVSNRSKVLQEIESQVCKYAAELGEG